MGFCFEPDIRWIRAVFGNRRNGGGHYATHITAAWKVVEKLKARYTVALVGGPDDEGGCEEWTCRITARGYRSQLDTTWQATATTAPRAICLAALKVGEGK